MSISCDCSYDDYGGQPSFYTEKIVRKARGRHICCECGGEISPGDSYHKVFGIWDGDPGVYKTCIPCVRIRDTYCPRGYIFGNLRDTVWNCLGVDYLGEWGVDDDD